MPKDQRNQSVHLRTACDPCSSAKVRCDKQHPSCDRCMQLSQPCSYSQSRRHGKRLWRRMVTGTRPGGHAPVTEGPDDSSAVVSSGSGPGPTRTVISSSLIAPSGPLPVAGHEHDLALNYMQQDVDPTSAFPASWLSGDSGLHAEIDIGLYNDWDITNLTPPDLVPSLEPSQYTSNTTTDEASPPSSTTTSPHDCEAQAIAILRSMQHGSIYDGLTSCSINPVQYAELNLRPAFDRVLATNKAALYGCARLMKCTCALCPHILLLHASILTKMFFWYRVAATEKIEPQKDTSQTPPDDPPTPNQFSVEPTGIQVGVLDLDPEDQFDLRRALLLRELRKAESVIDGLMNVDRTALDKDGNEGMKSSVDWSLGGIARVKKDFQDLIKELDKSP
ncbi:hypothetical protein F4808DRAFT_418426 [Astrocystis sublimbata]|nr:hypothetical protein F4808DRAFT_418426 [Astrocystis sublimbata]